MNPLIASHHAAGAETQEYDTIEIVSTFGQPQAEYAAIRKTAGLMDLPQRGIIELTGKDRHAFLNNLVSNQTFDKNAKSGLVPGTVTYAFLLNLKGRVVLDLQIVELSDRTLLELDARLADMLTKLLDRYLFAEQVRVVNRTDLHEIALHGPKALELLASEGLHADSCGVGADPAGVGVSAWTGRLINTDILLWRADLCGVPGIHLIVPNDSAEAIWNHLLTRHGQELELGKRAFRPVGWAAFNAARIEAGTPLFGIDFELAEPSVPGAKAQPGDENAPRALGVLPAETGLLGKAVSFTKGCYLGQEVVARMHARSQVARKLVGLKVADGALPFAGEHVFDEQQNQIGVITSSTMSPMLSDASIALAMLKKPWFEIGKSVRVPAEGAMRTATVVELPFL